VCENQLQIQTDELLLEDGQERTASLIDFIVDSIAALWKDWSKDMDVVNLPAHNHDPGGDFSLRGTCPHCSHPSSFVKVTTMHAETKSGAANRFVAAMQCQACLKFILAIVWRTNGPYQYDAHYPIGKPDDSVDEVVPVEIRTAFQEALRCRWVKAYQATVLTCRRALQVSCDRELLEPQADQVITEQDKKQNSRKDLYTQIDELATKQRITAILKTMAHRIRLLGKRGAHGDYSDIDATIGEKDADDAITFMRHYLDHVYVLPARLAGPVTAPTE
jgi:hypothetical protein